MNYRQTILCAVILGVVAAGVVWYLERFEVEKMHNQVSEYLRHQADFKKYLTEREGSE